MNIYSPITAALIFFGSIYYLFVYLAYIRFVEKLKEQSGEFFEKMGGSCYFLFLNNIISLAGIRFLFSRQYDLRLKPLVLREKNKLKIQYTIVFSLLVAIMLTELLNVPEPLHSNNKYSSKVPVLKKSS